MKELFDEVSIACSRLTTRCYSTSFSLGIRFLSREIRDPVYAIYGFVRFADEIVDSFHAYDKEELLQKFKDDTREAIDRKISLNPILNSFQHVFNRYHLSMDHVETFLYSMEMDLNQTTYNRNNYEKYILGSAEVVGLMCLKIFVQGDEKQYRELEPYAMRLGAAFQKINFLRDMHADHCKLGRVYFPNLEIEIFDERSKKAIEEEIQEDFSEGFKGIKRLPKEARFGVYMAYVYYYQLFNKIKRTSSRQILQERMRISDVKKYLIFCTSSIRYMLHRW